MRVSNLHHETAIRVLSMLQEADPGLYDKVVKRLKGIDTYTKTANTYKVSKLPFMFSSWIEYRDYLLEKLIENEEARKKLAAKFAGLQETIDFVNDPAFAERIYKSEITTVLVNDHEGTKLHNLTSWIEREKRKVEKERGIKYVDRGKPSLQCPVDSAGEGGRQRLQSQLGGSQ